MVTYLFYFVLELKSLLEKAFFMSQVVDFWFLKKIGGKSGLTKTFNPHSILTIAKKGGGPA
jgi:hypothetical protein